MSIRHSTEGIRNDETEDELRYVEASRLISTSSKFVHKLDVFFSFLFRGGHKLEDVLHQFHFVVCVH